MDQLHKEALAFQSKVNDYTDDHSHNIAQSLKREVQAFEDEVQVNKNPRSVENRVKVIIGLLEQARNQEVISYGDATELIRNGEEFREKLRKLF